MEDFIDDMADLNMIGDEIDFDSMLVQLLRSEKQ
jgi:hypothetical protein